VRFVVPLAPLSIQGFLLLIFQNKALANSYIESLHMVDINGSLNSLTLVLHLSHHPGLFDIKLQLPAHSMNLVAYYCDHSVVTFAPHPLLTSTRENGVTGSRPNRRIWSSMRAVMGRKTGQTAETAEPSTGSNTEEVDDTRRIQFEFKPTLLFLWRTLVLFKEEAGPTDTLVSKSIGCFRPRSPFISARMASCSVLLFLMFWDRSSSTNTPQRAMNKPLDCAKTSFLGSANRYRTLSTRMSCIIKATRQGRRTEVEAAGPSIRSLCESAS
jgi:hypothetical protein